MKLAELLKERGALQAKADSLVARISDNVRTADDPAEDANALLQELDSVHDALERRIQQINAVNAATVLPNGDTLSDILVRRDVLTKRINARKTAADRASKAESRLYGEDRVASVRHVDVPALRKQVEEMSRDYRKLDNQIQELNWTITVD